MLIQLSKTRLATQLYRLASKGKQVRQNASS
jgi:hypothetical protein